MLVLEVDDGYPLTLPLIAVSYPSLRYAFLRHLTLQLAQKSEEHSGMAMACALIDALTDLLSEATQLDFKLSSNYPSPSTLTPNHSIASVEQETPVPPVEVMAAPPESEEDDDFDSDIEVSNPRLEQQQPQRSESLA